MLWWRSEWRFVVDFVVLKGNTLNTDSLCFVNGDNLSYFADDVSFPCFASLNLGQHLEDNYETVDLKYVPTYK